MLAFKSIPGYCVDECVHDFIDFAFAETIMKGQCQRAPCNGLRYRQIPDSAVRVSRNIALQMEGGEIAAQRNLAPSQRFDHGVSVNPIIKSNDIDKPAH